MLSCNTDTEIDFTTYMRQVEVFLAGERDYSLIKGPSGPLVSVRVLCMICSEN